MTATGRERSRISPGSGEDRTGVAQVGVEVSGEVQELADAPLPLLWPA